MKDSSRTSVHCNRAAQMPGPSCIFEPSTFQQNEDGCRLGCNAITSETSAHRPGREPSSLVSAVRHNKAQVGRHFQYQVVFTREICNFGGRSRTPSRHFELALVWRNARLLLTFSTLCTLILPLFGLPSFSPEMISKSLRSFLPSAKSVNRSSTSIRACANQNFPPHFQVPSVASPKTEFKRTGVQGWRVRIKHWSPCTEKRIQ